MQNKRCSICLAAVEREDAPVISMGLGNPRLLCDDCAGDFDVATTSDDTDEIAAAMDRIGAKLAATNPDRGTYRAVNNILSSAAERAKAIKEGTYDFSIDSEKEHEGMEEIPEELKETEEDRKLDARDEEKQKQFDRFFNYVSIGAIGAVLVFVIWRLLDIFVF